MKYIHDDCNGLTGRIRDDGHHKDGHILHAEHRHQKEIVRAAAQERARELARNMRITPR